MASGNYVDKLKPGDVFRDWLVEVVGDSIHNKNCEVRVFKIPASHTVCRYEFRKEGVNVMAKFFAEPTGMIKKYDHSKAMNKEYRKLKKLNHIIDTPKPIATKKAFNCVLVTEYIPGKPLSWHLKHEKDLYYSLESIARLLRKLHENTRTHYNKEHEFAKVYKTLEQLKPDHSTRKRYEQLIEKWYSASFLDRKYGCMIHHDATPANYLFHRGKPYAIDFELSSSHGNCVHDLGILCAELKYHFALKNSDRRGEHYIRHFLKSYNNNEKEFYEITRVLPFYMGYGLLRIARRSTGPGHREYLLREAKSCFKAVNL